ncbi:MAG: sugar transferase [bacterium]|nr:sugar transferase [bacterium]
MKKKNELVFTGLNILLDIIGINLAFSTAYWISFRANLVPVKYIPPPPIIFTNIPILISINFLWIFVFSIMGMYDLRRGLSKISEFHLIVKSVSTAIIILTIGTFLSKTLYDWRLTVVYTWLTNLLYLSILRFIIIQYRLNSREKGMFLCRTLIIGAGETGIRIAEELKNFPKLGYKVIGFIDNDPEKLNKEIHELKVLGNDGNLKNIIVSESIEEIIISIPPTSHKAIYELLLQLKDTNTTLKIVPDFLEVVIGKVKIRNVEEIPLIELAGEPIYGWSKILKRTTDVVVSLIALLIFTVPALIIMILIKLDSPGKIFFKQERIGKRGIPFNLYKFRSMMEDAEKHTGPVWAQENDNRITRLGNILRKTSLDEIPQLWCILKGDMSLVGPRPEREFFIQKHTELQDERLLVKPGITGLAQVNGRYHLTIHEKAKYDLFYIRNHSFVLDVKILLKTIIVVLTQYGAR